MTDIMTDDGMCPRCEEHSMMVPVEINALSRTTRGVRDTPVLVCFSLC